MAKAAKAIPANGTLDPIEARVQALEQSFGKLVEVFTHNNKAMRTAFEITDAQFLCLRRVIHDSAFGQLRPHPLVDDNVAPGAQYVHAPGQTVDWQWYHEQYNQMRQFCAFIEWLDKLPIKKEKAIASHEVEFGGDYGQDQRG